MRTAEKIENYIKDCFEENSLEYGRYFSIYDEEDDELVDVSLVQEDGQINLQAVSRAAEILGMDEKDILETNEDKVMYWWQRYYYLQNIHFYESACESAKYGRGYQEQRLLEAIYDSKIKGPYPPKYNYLNVKERLLALLKEYDEVRPGTYHEGAELEKLTFSTSTFCHFKDIEKLLDSYIEMAERLFELFVAGVSRDFNEEEMKEYNFLVSLFGFRDRFYYDADLHYSNLINCRALYQDVCRANIYDYIAIDRTYEFVPWMCAEFVANKVLVQKYLDVFPQVKQHMREFAMAASKFECTFRWSDDEIKPLPDNYLDDIMCDDVEISLPHCVYVSKTKDELNGDDEVAEALLGYCRAEKLGGLKIRYPKQYDSMERIKKITAVVGKIKKNNFFEDKSNFPGGGTDE